MVTGHVDGVLILAPVNTSDLSVSVGVGVTGQVAVYGSTHRVWAARRSRGFLCMMDHRLASWLVSGIVMA